MPFGVINQHLNYRPLYPKIANLGPDFGLSYLLLKV